MARTTLDNPELWELILNPPVGELLPKRLLFVDDWPAQLEQVCRRIDDTWIVGVVKDPDDIFTKLKRIAAHTRRTEKLVISIDLVLFPARGDDIKIGLDLLRRLRKQWIGLPLIVHSAVDLPTLPTQQVIEQEASFILLRDDDAAHLFANVLDYILSGCVILSKRAAEDLTKLANLPVDPFAGNWLWWETISLLLEKKTYFQVANALEITEAAVSERVAAIFRQLKLHKYDISTTSDQKEPKDYKKRAVMKWAEENTVLVNFYLHKLRMRLSKEKLT